MKIITFNQIKELNLSKEKFYEWAEDVFLNKHLTFLPEKTSIKLYDGQGFMNTMPSVIPHLNVYGVKVVTRNPNSVPNLKSNIMLFDLNSNDLLAVMDADYITAFRTGATAALAIQTLAIPNYKTIALIGLGNICRATILVLLSKVKERHLVFRLHLYEGTDNGIIALLKKYKNVSIETYDNIEGAIRGSDVVVSCVTFAANDLAEPSWFKNGVLLVPVHTRGFLECDKLFDRVIIDDREHCKGFKNYNMFKNCSELGEVLKNPSLGRKNNDERIIAYNVGISILDISFAKRIFDCISASLDDYDISDTKKMCWVE